ncbi:chaperonin 10-like protein [Ilyonectria robusta]|uniref:chaperonin 10-like protein n=1 Tax=Ilyonectria robusta TaxID=1079257 RepID=UPI001E8E290F|nr:chaperonin 10-like protein [Ilyonectria robusta]KAH8679211.1 chaperonin 10-like protein [Ilyonectria robusta]
MAKDQTSDVAFLPAVATDLVLGKRQIPSPGPGEVLIRNHAIAVNPVDWKRQSWGFMISSYPVVLGADISGIVSQVGSSVTEFKPGDRVLAIAHSFCSGNNDNGAFQNFTIVNAAATTALPHGMSFQQGVTLPTAVGTGAIALFDVLDLPRPTVGTVKNLSEPESPVILVWGGASTAGSLTIQLARLTGLTVYTTASERHHDYLRSLGASVLVDYHSPTAVDDLLAAAKLAGTQISYAVDAISTSETLASVLQILSKSTEATKKLAHTSPWPENIATPDGIETGAIRGDALADRRLDLCAWLFNDTLPKWLERGDIVPTAYRVIDGGLNGLQNALNELKKGVSREKLVVEV